MEKIFHDAEYQEDISYAAKTLLPWEKLQDSSLIISGATGMIGTFLIDTIMHQNKNRGLGCAVYALGRDEKKARERLGRYFGEPGFRFITADITKPIDDIGVKKIGYVLHLASNTHPAAYAKDPVGTISANIYGLKNMLDFAVRYEAVRAAFASSNEIYGENRGDSEFFDEAYCGYIDCNTLRAGYPESKRCGEALCQAYIRQEGLDVVIPRLTRSYGPTMLMSDTKAVSQFIKKGISGEDIVLKSEGTQYYSYTYAADAVTGLLTVLLAGRCGAAYNIADEASDVRLCDLAEIVAGFSGKKVVFEVPEDSERIGYSTATKARLDGARLYALGWRMKYDIVSGIERTMRILSRHSFEKSRR